MKPTAILTGDIHIRNSVPIARCDDYVSDQWKAIAFVINLAIENKCPILDAGDLLDKWEVSSTLLYDCIMNIPKNIIYTIPGNHDLPNHNLDELNKSGLGVLGLVNITVLKDEWIEFPGFGVWGKAYNSSKLPPVLDEKSVLLTHEMVWNKKPLYPGLTRDSQAIRILKKYPNFDLIVSGHNHQSFTVEHEGRRLVNCGSLRRMRADQTDFKPRVWFWYEKTNTVEPVFLPIKTENVFDLSYLVKKKKKEEQKEELVARLEQDDGELDISFELNCEKHLETHRVRRKTKSLVLESIE